MAMTASLPATAGDPTQLRGPLYYLPRRLADVPAALHQGGEPMVPIQSVPSGRTFKAPGSPGQSENRKISAGRRRNAASFAALNALSQWSKRSFGLDGCNRLVSHK